MRAITHGATDQSIELYIVDADGLPATGLAFNSAGIDLWYRRNGAAVTSITEATQTASGAHSDGGFVHLANGVYRLDPPDAAFASGVSHVTFGGTITGYTIYPVTVQLTAFDLQTATQAVTVTTNNDKTGYSLTQAFPSNFASLGINASGHVSRVTLADTVTTLTGHTAQTGDAFARLGAPAGASISADIATKATASGLTNVSNQIAALPDSPAITSAVEAATPGAGFFGAAEAPIADAVWDEARAGHTTAGTFGFYLDSAISGVSGGGGSMAWSDLLVDIDDVPNSAGERFVQLLKAGDTILLDQEAQDALTEGLTDGVVAAIGVDPRQNRKPSPGFTTQVSRRADGTYKCTRPIRLTAGTVTNIFVFIDMSPLFGADDYVASVGTPTVSAGSVTASATGPRDTYAIVQLAGTATAGEERTVTVPVTMESGPTLNVVFDLEVFE